MKNTENRFKPSAFASGKLEFVGLFGQWCAGGKWDAAKAPLCKGSWPGGPEGLCSTVLQFRKCFGEKAYGNDFAVESSYFNDASAKRGRNGHCSFGRWAHREVHHYNPSVSFADSSPYTGEPLAHTASGRKPLPKQPAKFQFIRLLFPCGSVKKSLVKAKDTSLLLPGIFYHVAPLTAARTGGSGAVGSC